MFCRPRTLVLCRPVTAGTQFRKNMNDLMATLMVKMPSYVRCIKPNGQKKANFWDPAVVEHQVKYVVPSIT
jgi:myosin I